MRDEREQASPICARLIRCGHRERKLGDVCPPSWADFSRPRSSVCPKGEVRNFQIVVCWLPFAACSNLMPMDRALSTPICHPNQFVDLIDHDNAAALRAKLLAIAKVSTESSAPSPSYSFKAFLRGPLESMTESLEWTRRSTASELIIARADIARLCRTSPATDTYRYVCAR